jgi:hypothetical protein
MDRKIASLEHELETLRTKHAAHEKSLAELERLGSAQAPVVKAGRDKLSKKIATVEKRLSALRDEQEPVAEIDVADTLKDCAVTDPDAMALREIQAHAKACDEHAAGLAKHVKALHQAITAQRMKHRGRGPSAALVASALERAFARHATGTVLRSMRGPAPFPNNTGFESQIRLWEPMLKPVPASSPSLVA